VFDGRAGISFTATPADVISRLEQVHVEAETLLIVENQTPFEILVQPERRNPRILYLFGAGLPGQAQRNFTVHCLRAKPTLNWFVWTDYDLGGVAIQRFWRDWALQERVVAPQPYRWESSDLVQCQAQGIPLHPEQREQLAKKSCSLAQRLLEVGYAIEQEAILSIFERW
jgi:DNA topoisomerase VI subunit A